MAASDNKSDTGTRDRLIRAASYASLTVALTLVFAKLWAWQATGAISILSSLADSVLDVLASAITFVAVRYALTPADREHRFGHGKTEGLAALAQSFMFGAAIWNMKLVPIRNSVHFAAPNRNAWQKKGGDTHVGHEDWLADKRAVLHSRMRERRRSRATSGAWKVSLW